MILYRLIGVDTQCIYLCYMILKRTQFDLVIKHIQREVVLQIYFGWLYDKLNSLGQKKGSCVQVSEVQKIRVGRSKNIFILEFLFITNVQRL